jgi:ketosteroid isomerase-like protein
MKNALLLLLCLSGCAHNEGQVRHRLDEIWSAGASRDLDRLASFHLYGPHFTEFKDGQPRGDAASGAAAERAFFSAIPGSAVDMKDLKIDLFGDTAVATYNGHFAATMQGHPISADMGVTMVFVYTDGDWKIAHEHFSPLRTKEATR